MLKSICALLVGLLAAQAQAQLNIPNPTIRPMSAKGSGGASPEGALPPIPPPPAPRTDGGQPQGTVHASLATATKGLYVAAIVNKRAVLRGPAPGTGAIGAAAQGNTGARMLSYTVKDGESFLLSENQEVQVRIQDKQVLLYALERGKKQLVFRGEVDSLAPTAPARPIAADLVPRNTDYVQRRSVSSTTGAGASATAGAAAR